MSKKDEKASEKELDGPQNDSVFDFLYNDTRRIGSFLAQFDEAGYLEKIVQRDVVTKSKKRGIKFSVGGGATILGTGGSGSFGMERGPSDEGSESSERYYDPLWTNARTLLDYLESREMIKRGVSDAKLGQFVLTSGTLVVLDLPLLKNAWGKQSIQKLMRAAGTAEAHGLAGGNRHQRRSDKSPAPATPQAFNQVDMLIDMMSIMPHSLQARLFGDGTITWCSLDEQFVVGKSSDLVLKHGSLIPGEWNMLGVLDAHPDNLSATNEDGQSLADLIANSAGTAIGTLAANLAVPVRTLLGRPENAFGVTPLLIFREVAGS